VFGHGDLFFGMTSLAARSRHHDVGCLLFFHSGFFMASQTIRLGMKRMRKDDLFSFGFDRKSPGGNAIRMAIGATFGVENRGSA
jgi:hypothetical protein